MAANRRRHTSSLPQQESSSKRKRKAGLVQNDEDFSAPSRTIPIIPPQATTHQKTSDAQMDERLAVVLNPPPLPTRAIPPAEPTTVEQNPKRGRGRPPGSSRKRPKLLAGLTRADVDTASSSAPDTTATPETTTTATASARPSKIVVLKYRFNGSKQEAAEEGETTKEEVMVPRRGLRVKTAAKGRDTI